MRTFSQVISAREWENQHITHHNVIELTPLSMLTVRSYKHSLNIHHTRSPLMGNGNFSCSMRLN